MGGNQSLTSSKYNENLHILQELEKNYFDLNEDNIDQIVENSLLYFSEEYPYSSHFIICRIVYAYFIKKGDEILCFKYLQKIEQETKYKMINIFINFLCANNFQETNYLLEKMYENEITERKIDQNIKSSYFIHYLSKEEIHILNRERFMKEISNNYEDLSKNDFKLHKELIKEGHNPNKIAKMIRNDEIEKLQEISSQTNFNFDQTIEPSLYERCSFINKDDVTLIDYAAFFSSIKCFKYLLMNGAKVENTGKYAIAGGNEEIIHLCEQNHSSFTEAYETAIEFHRNDIFHYLYENNIVEINNLEELGKICILHDNFNILSFLEKEGMIMNETLINESIITGNLFIFQYFQSKNPKSINFLEISGFCSNEELSNYLIKYKYIDLRNDVSKFY